MSQLGCYGEICLALLFFCCTQETIIKLMTLKFNVISFIMVSYQEDPRGISQEDLRLENKININIRVSLIANEIHISLLRVVFLNIYFF